MFELYIYFILHETNRGKGFSVYFLLFLKTASNLAQIILRLYLLIILHAFP